MEVANAQEQKQTSTKPTRETATMAGKWCSKLGNQYDMAMMERNDARTKRELDRLRFLPSNRICADCGNGSTVWASVNLGVFLCIRCGSHHRGIGTHISKPKGCTGTYLWGPDEIDRMSMIGNERANKSMEQIVTVNDLRRMPRMQCGDNF